MAAELPSEAARKGVNAIIPLALLRTLRELDQSHPIDYEELSGDLAPRRLGTSATVLAQIERFQKLVKRGRPADGKEVLQLFSLVGRRNDAELAFDQAGREAAAEILRLTTGPQKLVQKAGKVVARQRVERKLASGLADRLLDVELSFDDENGVKGVANGSLHELANEGQSCGFYGSAIAEILRRCANFEGAMLHTDCRARGDEICAWNSTARPDS